MCEKVLLGMLSISKAMTLMLLIIGKVYCGADWAALHEIIFISGPKRRLFKNKKKINMNQERNYSPYNEEVYQPINYYLYYDFTI